MGTVSEIVDFNIDLLKYLRIGVFGNHSTIMQHDISFEKLGGPLRGEVYKNSYTGNIKAGAVLPLSFFIFNPFAALDAQRTESTAMVRIIEEVKEEGDPQFPEDTFAFADIGETELLVSGYVGCSIELSGNPVKIELEGSYSPFIRAKLDGSYLQNYPSFPNPSTTSYPSFANYWWKKHQYSMDTIGNGFCVKLNLIVPAVFMGIRTGVLGEYAQEGYEASTSITSYDYSPYKSDYASDTDIIEAKSSALANVTVLDRGIKGGITFQFIGLKDMFKLPGTPILDIYYSRVIRKNNFEYYDPVDRKEQWIEDFDYLVFQINWGL